MAYQAGTFADNDDLIDKIDTFLVGQGWTKDNKQVDGTGKRAHFHKTGQFASTDLYMNFRSAVNEDLDGSLIALTTGIAMNMSEGFSGTGDSWARQGTSYPGFVSNKAVDNPYAPRMIGIGDTPNQRYFFFHNLNPTVFAIVVEYTPGRYSWMFGGEIVKLSTFTGGQFGSAQWGSETNAGQGINGNEYHPFDRNNGAMNSFVRADTDVNTVPWQLIEEEAGSNVNRVISARGFWNDNLLLGPNDFNALAPLITLPIFAQRPASQYFMLGYIDHVREINLGALNNEEEITFGSETWKVFPHRFKGTSGGNTGDLGLAFRKTA